MKWYITFYPEDIKCLNYLEWVAPMTHSEPGGKAGPKYMGQGHEGVVVLLPGFAISW